MRAAGYGGRFCRYAIGSLAALSVCALLDGGGLASARVASHGRPRDRTPARGAAIRANRLVAAEIVTDINAVRAKFGLAPGRVTTSFDHDVYFAAREMRDPTLGVLPPKVVTEDAIFGMISTTGDPSTLDPATIVNAWVYQDGWRGAATYNIDCTRPGASGCNGHRRAVLRTPPVPGAKLSIDVVAVNQPIDGANGLSIAAIMSWTAP